jgi:hypothetical protein
MNPFEKNAFDYSSFGKAFTAPFESAHPGIAAMQIWNGALVRASLEVAGFWSRRARAGLDAPSLYGRCRTLHDVASVNSELVTACLRDATETAQRSMVILTSPARTVAEQAAATGGFSDNGSPLRRQQPVAPRPAADRGTGTSASTAPASAAYEWWRTDMKAIVPRRNGHAGHEGESRAGR